MEASCAASAIEVIEGSVVDMLLVDFRLANRTASPLIEQVRAIEQELERPACDVVCITGASHVELTPDGPILGDFDRECERLGVVALFSKPVNFERLSQLLEEREAKRQRTLEV